MCVAAVIFNAVSLEYLKAMEDDNPHGAGVAWQKNGKIRFLKGLDAKTIHDLQEVGVLTYPYLMHYRWATHGEKVPELTHPFVLGPRALLGETSGECDALMMHNGTWGAFWKRATDYLQAGNYEIPEELMDTASDTAVAAFLALEDPDVLDDVPWATVTAEIRDGRMEITTRGTWTDKDGNWYSNLNWVPGQYSGRYGHYYDSDGSWWENWSNWYNQGKKEAEKDLSDPSFTTYDRYMERISRGIIEPYSVRPAEDKNLEWDQYVSKYGAVVLPGEQTNKHDETANGETRTEVYNSFEEYLEAKYGPVKKDQITSRLACGFDGECESGDCGDVEDLNEAFRKDPYIDPELVTDDFETVNEVLRRAADKGR